MGATVPPLTALSFTEIRQRLPATVPMPMMEPPPSTDFLPSSSCMLRPAKRLSSRNGEVAVQQAGHALARQQWPRFSNFCTS